MFTEHVSDHEVIQRIRDSQPPGSEPNLEMAKAKIRLGLESLAWRLLQAGHAVGLKESRNHFEGDDFFGWRLTVRRKVLWIFRGRTKTYSVTVEDYGLRNGHRVWLDNQCETDVGAAGALQIIERALLPFLKA